MAILSKDSPFFSATGRVGNLVFRRYGNKTVVSQMPSRVAPPTVNQIARRDLFRRAAAYARQVIGDPVRRAAYARLAPNQTVRQAALRDYLKPPNIDSIDTAGFHGQPGDGIHVLATDDTVVAQVTVILRTGHGGILEQGVATEARSRWTYRTTTLIPPGGSVFVEAVAIDLAGNRTTRSALLPGEGA